MSNIRFRGAVRSACVFGEIERYLQIGEIKYSPSIVFSVCIDRWCASFLARQYRNASLTNDDCRNADSSPNDCRGNEFQLLELLNMHGVERRVLLALMH